METNKEANTSSTPDESTKSSPKPFTLADLEKKLASADINADTLTVDPSQFLSINLTSAQDIRAREKQDTSNSGKQDLDPSLPVPDSQEDSSSITEFLSSPEALETANSESEDIDIDFEPIPVETSPYNKPIRHHSIEEIDNQSLLNPDDYQHIFEDEYLADFFDQELQDTKKQEQELTQALNQLNLDTDETTGTDSIPQDNTNHLVQQFHSGLGQSLYCLPCNPDKEETFQYQFDNNIDFGIDPSDIRLREQADFDFDNESLNDEDLQAFLQHVMLSEKNDANMDSQDIQQEDEPFYHVSQRQEALSLATPLVNAFYNEGTERQCFGHKDKIFGVAFSPCGRFFATASEDSTVKIWNVKQNSLVSTISGSSDHECLRVAWASSSWGSGNGSKFERKDGDLILATSGSDGYARILHSLDQAKSWKELAALDHLEEKRKNSVKPEKLNVIEEGDEENEEEKSAQEQKEEVLGTEIYSLQFIDKWSGLPSLESDGSASISAIMTSSEDFIHVWQYNPSAPDQEDTTNEKEENGIINIEKVIDIKFTHLEHGFGGVFVHVNSKNEDQGPDWSDAQLTNIITKTKAFGGDRNPDNLVFVFDAVQCPANNLVGAALSDGTLRLVNGRGICVTILQLPGCQSHLTSFTWDQSGYRLASTVATGHVVLWDIDYGDGRGTVQPVCRAVLEGGHQSGRPLFGARYLGGPNEDLLLSWGIDGKLCLWDSLSTGQIGAPICELVSKADYPIFAVDTYESSAEANENKSSICIAGGNEGGFIGMPCYLYNYSSEAKFSEQ
ncbi:hypothetical protein CTEN210_06316 [Chaetoceros tenuissimus]|uniref:Uncharacterized protein n=1 Tax=Chaetoceros tenuissimus TaxID=426638 RepID=A0AAD3CRQ8_9STRA|nr:hypothetical protein CTEN210_06316 [Chaetoceros tenuissimus]